ncbi:hypothetical protein ACIQ6V_21750 [Streptomyces sp. NPDC096198]|uniref:hypothetical protein n=1 Tax=Streptomyces sp. NPDC096198 TaxID=3366080 RepID=UPI003816BCE4
MKFSIRGGAPLDGVLTYDDSEYGFSFDARSPKALGERLGTKGVTSALIGTLQLEIDVESREIVYVWGYFPNVRGDVGDLEAPVASPGRVFLSSDDFLEAGVSFDVPGKPWRVTYDPSSGWVALRLSDAPATLVQIADGTVVGLDDGALVSLWLRPVFSG